MSSKHVKTRAKTTIKHRRQKKTFALLVPSLDKAQAILDAEKRPRSMTRLIEDLFDAEHDRLHGKAMA